MFLQCSQFLKVISLETTVISENRPTFENKPTLHFLTQFLQRSLLKVRPPIYSAVHGIMLSTKEAALCKRRDYNK